jgi:transcriptional regulator with XRE-family HTH domain
MTGARSRGRPARPAGSEIDQLVGGRIRQRRLALRISQQELADRLGVTCQQLQKYEKGTSRVAAGRLYMIAQALGTSVGHFFAGMPGAVTPPPGPEAAAEAAGGPGRALALRLLDLCGQHADVLRGQIEGR